jgi:hypothetical protein
MNCPGFCCAKGVKTGGMGKFILGWTNGVEPDLQGWLVLAFVGTERMAWAGVDR